MSRLFLPLHAVALCCTVLLATQAIAGRYSSGGRSYSSGSRASSSSSTRSTAPSRPAGSSSSGKSSFSSKPAISPGRSSGGSGFSSSTRPAAAPSRSSYSTGGSSYSTGRPRSGIAPVSNTSGYDAAAARARAVQNSSQKFTNSKKPAVSQPAENTAASPVPQVARTPRPRSPRLAAYSARPVVSYQDRYDPLFWWWLMDQSRPVRAQWVYHHHSEADPQRIAALQQADPALTGEVEALKTQQVPVNPQFAPAELPAEEMYLGPPTPVEDASLSLSNLAQDPQNSAPPGNYAPRPSTKRFSWLVLIGCTAFMVWLIFFKRWKVAVT